MTLIKKKKKKVLKKLHQYTGVKDMKGYLAAGCLACIYSVSHVLEFPLMTSNSWGRNLPLFLSLLITSFCF